MKNNQVPFRIENHPATIRTLALCGLLLVSLLICAGCAPKTSPTANTNLAGTYLLTSVDGKAVPCTVSHEGASPTIKSGRFVINTDGTCSSTVVFSVGSRPEASREVKATYTSEGPKLTMRWEGAGITTGSVQDNHFTMTNEGMVFAYQK
jgi:hypothetical protein